MKIGLLVPMWAEGETQPTWPVLSRYAQEAESAGFDSLWVADDAIFRLEGEILGIFGCISTSAALAAITNSIQIGSLVSNVHSRSPALLAKDADTLSIISGGRFVLGLGAGDDQSQHDALGMVWEGRFSAYEEAVTIISQLLRTGFVDYEGSYYRARNAVLRPRPESGPAPILVGGKGPRMLRIAAQHADIWNAFLAWREADLDELLRRGDQACEKIGRDPSDLARSVAVSVAFDDCPVQVGSTTFEDIGFRGEPEEIAEYFAGLAARGVSHVQVQTAPLNLWALERLAEAVARFRG